MQTPEPIRDIAQIPERASAAACFGVATSAGDRTVIPVVEVTYGMGFGWGSGSGPVPDGSANAEGGGGGGSRVRGIAVIEVSPDGVRVHPVLDETSIKLSEITFVSAAAAIVARTLLKLVRG